MMDNEQPWHPPEQQKISQIPKITPQVPDVTIFSPSNKLPNNNNKQNFMQRAMASEKVLNIPKQQQSNNTVFNNVKPSVPDVSLFEPANRVGANCFGNNRKSPASSTTSASSNMMFQKSNKSSKENIFEATARPTVPDVTILDEEPKPQEQETQGSTNPVFSESYKKLLIKSHEQFMKQMKNDKEETAVTTQRKKPGLFNSNYRDNPLRKYAPKPQPTTYQNDANSSSILIECDAISPPSSVAPEEKSDEMTFKKVAEMLSEIQKLVIPGKTTPDVMQEEVKAPEILRQLASTYLTREELEYYEVEKELNDLDDS